MNADEIKMYDEMDYMEYMESRSVPITNEIHSSLSFSEDVNADSETTAEVTKQNSDTYYVLSDYM